MFRHCNFLFLACLLLVVGCKGKDAQERMSCDSSDWYELGRRDGAMGATLERLAQHRESCSGTFDPQNEVVYRNGRNAGLVEYCSTRNGFELGRLKLTYYQVCPSTSEARFLKGYSNGSHARVLELQNQTLVERIDQVSDALTNRKLPPAKAENLKRELQSLNEARSRNDAEIKAIPK